MAKGSATNNWLYRASDKEHEVIKEAVRKGRYPSVASFVREACLRMAYEGSPAPIFSELFDVLEDLKEIEKEEVRRHDKESEAGVVPSEASNG